MELLRCATAHDTTISYSLAALATYPVQIDIIPQLVECYKELEPIILTGSRNVFDMAQKRGAHLISVLAAELIYLEWGELCATGPASKLLDVTSDVLTSDTFLNALCKRVNLWHGPTVGTAAADLLRAIAGCLDTLGTQKARDFVFALLQPFVSAAVLGCMQSFEEHGNIARPSQYAFSFSIQHERIPEEMSAASLRRFLAGKPIDSSPVASAQDDSVRGLKRGRDDDRQSPEAVAAPSGTAVDAECSRDEPSEGNCSGTDKPDDAIEGSPPQKKRKVHGSLSSIPIPPIPAAVPPVGTTKVPRTKTRVSEGKAEQQAVQGALSDISKACSLRHVSSKLLSSDHGPLTFGDKVDALVGKITFRYALFACLDDAAPPGSLNAHQATWAHRTLFSAQLTKRVASALGFPAAPKEHDPFMCALGRATYNRSMEEICGAILEIYDPIIRSVLKAVAPLQSSSDDTRSLESRRQHLRDLLELGSQGYAFHSCLSPLEAVLTTADHVVAAMLTEDLLTDLGIIQPAAVSA